MPSVSAQAIPAAPKGVERCLANSSVHGIIIGFRGKNAAFDRQSFEKFATLRNRCPIELDASSTSYAVDLASKGMPYELYGFSLGAASVRDALAQIHRRELRLPDFVVTVGAWPTNDLNFKRYGFPFLNVYDDTGKGQRSPGVFIQGVPHMQMQRHVLQNWDALQARAILPDSLP